MCNADALAALGGSQGVGAIGSGALGAYGTYLEGQARSEELRFSADEDNRNAARAERDALLAQEEANAAKQNVSFGEAQEMGEAIVAAAASGITTTTGSAMAWQRAVSIQSDIEKDLIQAQADEQKRGLRTERDSLMRSAFQKRRGASQASKTASFGIASSLAQGFAGALSAGAGLSLEKTETTPPPAADKKPVAKASVKGAPKVKAKPSIKKTASLMKTSTIGKFSAVKKGGK